MPSKRTGIVYGLLAVTLALFTAWQTFEHSRIRGSARTALLNRARDISNSVGVVIRSRGRFGFVPQPRIEAALDELTKSNELQAVAVLNAEGKVTASAGKTAALDIENLPESGERWGRETVTFVNLVDFGPAVDDEDEALPGPIIVPPREPEPVPAARDDGVNDDRRWTLRSVEAGEPLNEEQQAALHTLMADPLLDDEMMRGLRAVKSGDALSEDQLAAIRSIARGQRSGQFRHGRGGRPPFGRPPWMKKEEYEELVRRQGVRAFVLSMSTQAFRAECERDYWLRLALAGIAFAAAAGLGIAWHNFARSAALQMRLLRASEINAHLREMNVAAAGLAHETRNPLNMIRGRSQMIARHAGVSPEISDTAREISEEVDRVTGRLNQFMDYSRPPEAKPARTDLKAVIGDVARTLESDREDKAIQFAIEGPALTVEADESLLRQVLFNLLLNAIQAADHGGAVTVHTEKEGRNEVRIEVRDNGPGVPAEMADDIFRPYFTTSEHGTGLGLAVVRQIALAHQWEIEYVPGEREGAVFRLSGIRVS